QLTLGGLVETAGELAGRLGIGPDDRILVDAQVAAEAGPVAWLLAPLAAGASVVLCRYPIRERLPHRAAVERVTATLGVGIDGVRELGRAADLE
ncbi:MAG TPA: TIGR03089 family protein, partial [Blastococcus sp.]